MCADLLARWKRIHSTNAFFSAGAVKPHLSQVDRARCQTAHGRQTARSCGTAAGKLVARHLAHPLAPLCEPPVDRLEHDTARRVAAGRLVHQNNNPATRRKVRRKRRNHHQVRSHLWMSFLRRFFAELKSTTRLCEITSGPAYLRKALIQASQSMPSSRKVAFCLPVNKRAGRRIQQ